jgi:hypothetical protein
MYFKDLLSSNEHLIQIEVGCSKKKIKLRLKEKIAFLKYYIYMLETFMNVKNENGP